MSSGTVQGNDINRHDANSAISLKKQAIDLDSPRIQMLLGCLIVLGIVAINYLCTIKIGFLLDDFLHLDYIARAMHGDWHDFLANFTGNWAGSDVMISYRPLVCISLFFDYLLWQTKAGGYHLSNLIFYYACCLLVMLITFELSGPFGNRLGAAASLWAAMLFAVYPLHSESVAWVIGRVDLLSTMFYLAAVFLFLRYRLLKERAYQIAALVSFLLALASKEMAITLPFILFLASFLLPSPKSAHGDTFGRLNKVKLWTALQESAPFWLLLFVFAGARALILRTAIGGYGQTSFKSILLNWRIFLDKASLLKVLVPLSEERHLSIWWSKTLLALSSLIAAVGLLRLSSQKAAWRTFAFLVLWITFALLPTFQIWHIYPNLVGSRLFFLSSAPLSILIALACLPAIDSLTGRAARIYASVGVTLLTCLFAIWSFSLQENLKPWMEAGKQMRQLRTQLSCLIASNFRNQQILLLDLPTDFQGAGLLTRPKYLRIILKPPFAKADLSEKISTLEPESMGSRLFLDPPASYGITSRSSNLEFKWQDGTFVPWQPRNENLKNEWNFDPAKIFHADQQSSLDLPLANLNPSFSQVLLLHMKIASSDRKLLPNCWVVWQTNNQGNITNNQAAVFHLKEDLYVAWLGRYRNWVLNDPPHNLTLRFDRGDYVARLYSATICNARELQPSVSVDDHGSIDCDCRHLPNCHGFELMVSRFNHDFFPKDESDLLQLPPATDLETILVTTSNVGRFDLSSYKPKAGATRKIQVVAVDKEGKPIDLPSDELNLTPQ